MAGPRLDDVDEKIINLLQRDARMKTTDLADHLPVSANTVRNRIEKLEADGIIQGYRVTVDYTETDVPIFYQFTCTAPIAERERLATAALEVDGVVKVTELMTGQRNLVIRVVGREQEDITEVARTLDDIGIVVVDETLIKREHRTDLSTFDHGLAAED